MGIKQKLGLGVASAALGLALVGGGTYAYFNDVETSNNTFAAGTLDLALNPTEIFNISNLKPGDYMLKTFEMKNEGSLDIAKVLLDTSYTVTDAKGDNGSADFGDHIVVKFIKNDGHPEYWGDNDSYTVVYEKTLKQLSSMTPDKLAVELEDLLWWDYEQDGIPAGGKDNMRVKIEFKDNQQDQNIFQGDTLNLEWKFTGKQEAGEDRS
jgi:spore coat-associated protein N